MKETKIHSLLPIEKIKEPANPIRSGVDQGKFDELKGSIKEIGLIEPLIVRKEKGKFEIVAGHRRFLACREIGMTEVSCMIMANDADLAESVKLHENIVREDINLIDEAGFLAGLQKRHKCTGKELAVMVRKSEGYVKSRLALLGWPNDLLQALGDGKVNYTVGRELAGIVDEEGLRTYLNYAINSGANHRTVKKWVKEYNALREAETVTQETIETATTTQQPIDIKYPCTGCKDEFKIEETVLLRFCHGCGHQMVG